MRGCDKEIIQVCTCYNWIFGVKITDRLDDWSSGIWLSTVFQNDGSIICGPWCTKI